MYKLIDIVSISEEYDGHTNTCKRLYKAPLS